MFDGSTVSLPSFKRLVHSFILIDCLNRKVIQEPSNNRKESCFLFEAENDLHPPDRIAGRSHRPDDYRQEDRNLTEMAIRLYR